MADLINKQPAYAGEANHDNLGVPPDMSGFGGGMSASENRMVNHAGKIISAKGGPKDTSGGKSLDKNATNKFATPGCNPPSASPDAEPQSRNKSYKSGGY
jgi:hypothetical protein